MNLDTQGRARRLLKLKPMTAHDMARCLGTSTRYMRAVLETIEDLTVIGKQAGRTHPWNLYAIE